MIDSKYSNHSLLYMASIVSIIINVEINISILSFLLFMLKLFSFVFVNFD